jgi:hypothetical protein
MLRELPAWTLTKRHFSEIWLLENIRRMCS